MAKSKTKPEQVVENPNTYHRFCKIDTHTYQLIEFKNGTETVLHEDIFPIVFAKYQVMITRG